MIYINTNHSSYNIFKGGGGGGRGYFWGANSGGCVKFFNR